MKQFKSLYQLEIIKTNVDIDDEKYIIVKYSDNKVTWYGTVNYNDMNIVGIFKHALSTSDMCIAADEFGAIDNRKYINTLYKYIDKCIESNDQDKLDKLFKSIFKFNR